MVDPGLIWGRVIAGVCFREASQAPENGFIGTSECFVGTRVCLTRCKIEILP